MTRRIMTIALSLAVLAALAPAALAGPGFKQGGCGGGGGFGIVINPGPQRNYDDDCISCRTGKRIVRNSGCRRVLIIECSGNTYTYKGKRGSRVYRLSVDMLDGIIVGRRRLLPDHRLFAGKATIRCPRPGHGRGPCLFENLCASATRYRRVCGLSGLWFWQVQPNIILIYVASTCPL